MQLPHVAFLFATLKCSIINAQQWYYYSSPTPKPTLKPIPAPTVSAKPTASADDFPGYLYLRDFDLSTVSPYFSAVTTVNVTYTNVSLEALMPLCEADERCFALTDGDYSQKSLFAPVTPNDATNV